MKRNRDRVSFIMILLLLTKFLGFIKIRIIAELFGVSRELDLFWAAFTIPDTLFNVLVAGAINAAIIPVFSETLHKDGEGSLKKLFTRLNLLFITSFSLLGLLGFIFAPQIGKFLIDSSYLHDALQSTTNITADDLALFTKLMRIMMLSPLFLGVSSIFTAFLQVRKRFFSTALAPLFYNIGMIVVSLFLVRFYHLGVEAVAWSVVVGSFFHMVIQLPLTLEYYNQVKNGVKDTIKGYFKLFTDSEVVEVVKLGFPRVIGLLAEHVNVFVNTIISFTLGAGALSAYKFAFSLHLLPVHIFGSAISQVALPNMAEFYAVGKMRQFKETFNKAIHQSMFLILPVAATFLTLKLPIVRLTLNFADWEATTITATSLAILSVAVVGQALILVILRTFYAIKETKLILIATFVTMVVNIAGSYLFTNFFSHYTDWRPILNQIFTQIMQMNGDGLAPVVGSFVMDTFRWMTTRGNSFASVYGLAFSTSISFVVEAVLGIWLLSRKLKVFSFKETVMPLFPMILNSAITSAAMYVMFKLVDQFLNTEKTLFVVLLSGLVFLYGGVVYAIGSKVFRIKEFDYIFNEATKLLSSIVGRVGRPMKHVEEK